MTEGKNGIYIAWNIFEDYAENGAFTAKQTVCRALDLLLGKKVLETNLGSMGIATLMKQDERYVAHLLYAVPTKRGENIEVIEEIYSVYGIELCLNVPEKIKRVYLAPQREEIPFEETETGIRIGNITVDCSSIIVAEF